MRNRVLVLPCVILAAACGSDRRAATGADGGTFVVTVPAEAQSMLPVLTQDAVGSDVQRQLFDRLADPGPTLRTFGDAGFEPRLARSWSWSADSLSIAFAIDPRARWHDGQPVTARDVRFTWELYADSAVNSPFKPLVASIESVTVRDPSTAVFWFKRRGAEQFWDATSIMRIHPEHLLSSVPRGELKTSPFARHPVGNGPFRFVSWTDRQAISLEANTDYYRGRPHLDRVIWTIAPDPQSAVLRLFAGEADFYQAMRPPDVAALKDHPEVAAATYPSLNYSFLAFNERDPKNIAAPHPIFADRELRRALSMAIDRARLVQSVFDTLATTGHGPITPAVATFDPTIALLPYAPDSAKKLLDALGWRATGANGQRMKGGKPLAFTITVPNSSVPRQQLAVLVQEELKQIGVRVEVEQTDFSSLSARVASRNFDATIWTIILDPSPSAVRQSWGTAAAAPGGSNLTGYRSAAFDGDVDSAGRQLDAAKARAYYRRAYETIIADAPAVWIDDLKNAVGLAKRVHPAAMRADGWGVNLKDWSIPPAERIARDNAANAPPAPPAKP